MSTSNIDPIDILIEGLLADLRAAEYWKKRAIEDGPIGKDRLEVNMQRILQIKVSLGRALHAKAGVPLPEDDIDAAQFGAMATTTAWLTTGSLPEL